MLSRIYVDNYKCLVNFELNLDKLTVLLGENGSGKSTVFEVLRKLQQFIGGEAKSNQLFSFSDRCRWQNVLAQTFELDFTMPEDGGVYRYVLVVEHAKEGDKSQVKEEKLFLNNQPLFAFEHGEIQLYDDASRPGPKFPFDWAQSGLAPVYSRPDNTRLTQFKEQVFKMIVTQIIPPMMLPDSSGRGDLLPAKNLENYVGWYRMVSQDQGLTNRLSQSLKQVLDNFDSFRFVPYGAKFLLEAKFTYDGVKNSISYQLHELSDGQKMLIALYALLETARSEYYMMCLDEPDNVISLSEVQPWLNAMYDLASDNRSQFLLISHHPEAIDLFSSHARWLERPNGLATRISPLPESEDELRISEMIARRWLP